MGLSDSITDETVLCDIPVSLVLFQQQQIKVKKMKAAILACVLLGLAASAYAEEEQYDMASEVRFLYFNTLSTATSLTLFGALILLGVIGYLVYVGGLLGTSFYIRIVYYGQVDYQQGAYDYSQQAQYRSANDGYDYNGLNIIQWISMLQDLYEKFDY